MLSEQERRTLREIEDSLTATDPGLAASLGWDGPVARRRAPLLLALLSGCGVVGGLAVRSAPLTLLFLLVVLGAGLWSAVRRGPRRA